MFNALSGISHSQNTLITGMSYQPQKPFEWEQIKGSGVIFLYTVNQWLSMHPHPEL